MSKKVANELLKMAKSLVSYEDDKVITDAKKKLLDIVKKLSASLGKNKDYAGIKWGKARIVVPRSDTPYEFFVVVQFEKGFLGFFADMVRIEEKSDMGHEDWLKFGTTANPTYGINSWGEFKSYPSGSKLTALFKKNIKPPRKAVDWSKVDSLAKKHVPWFDAEVEDDEAMWSSREYGNVGDETPGDEDISAARNFGRAVKGLKGFSVSLDVVDEWVSVTVVPDE